MTNLVKKIKNLISKEPIDETASRLSFINTPPYLEYKCIKFDVRVKGMGTGAIAFRKLVLEKGKLEEIYEGFSRRDRKQFTFPLGICHGPTDNGPGIEFDLEVNKTANPNEIYFRLREPGQYFSHLVGKISKLSKSKVEKITYGYAAALTSGKLPCV